MTTVDARHRRHVPPPRPTKTEARPKTHDKHPEKAQAKAQKSEPQGVSPAKLRALDRFDAPRASSKPQAKQEPKQGVIDRWVGKNDGNGLRANSVKSFSDFGMMLKGGRDVRANRYHFGPVPLPRVSDKMRQTAGTRNTRFTRSASGLGGTLGAYQLKASGATMVKDLRDGFRKGWTRDRVNTAIGSTASFTSVGLNTAKSFKELHEARKQVKEVTAGFRKAVDAQGRRWNLHADTNLTAHLRHQIQTKADETSKAMAKKFLGASGDVSAKALKGIAKEKIGWAATHAPGAAKAMATRGLKAAKLASKAGGRFIPGANAAIAVADTAAFYSTLHDKKASTGKKIAAGVTAAGSVLAATDIPVVAQTGAVVSTVASVFTNDSARRFASNVATGAANKAKNAVKKLKFW